MSTPDGARERLPRSGSLVWPVVGYVTVGLFVLLALVDGFEALDLTVLAACSLAGGLVFVLLQRPVAAVDAETLHLRGALSTVHIPLAAIERVAVSRFLAVFAGERRYVSTSVQRSVRALMGRRPRASRAPATTEPERLVVTEADLVEQRISQLAEDARARGGVRRLSDEQLALAAGVHRTWSAAAVALLAVPTGLLLVAVLVVV